MGRKRHPPTHPDQKHRSTGPVVLLKLIVLGLSIVNEDDRVKGRKSENARTWMHVMQVFERRDQREGAVQTIGLLLLYRSWRSGHV